jgi:hypothetical protein
MAGQNPVYPDDRFLTDDEVKAKSRAGTLLRAVSPGELICVIDQYDIPGAKPGPPGDPNSHLHPTPELIQWRHDHVVPDDDAWTYYLLYDQWAQQFVAPPPAPPPPPAPHGWLPMVRTNPRGISYMNGWAQDFTQMTFANLIGPSRALVTGFGPGTQWRITMTGQCTLAKCFVGPASGTLWKAASLQQVKFGGSNSVVIPYNTPPAPDWVVVSDPFPAPASAPNGIIVSGFVSGYGNYPYPPVAWLQTKGNEADWFSRFDFGDTSAQTDKTNLKYDFGFNDISVLMIEAFYP